MIEAVRPLHPDDSIRVALASDLEVQAACLVDSLSKRVTGAQRSSFEQLASQLCAVVRSLDARRLQIVRDENLTVVGKRAALVKAAQEAHAKIREMRSANIGWQQHLEQLEQSLTRDQSASRSAEDRVVAYLREREVRDLLRGMDAIQVDALYRQAAQEGNDVVCQAVEQDPLGQLVLREAIDSNRRTRLLSRDAAKAELHGQLSALAESWSGLLDEAEKLIGVSIDHTLEDAAGGAG